MPSLESYAETYRFFGMFKGYPGTGKSIQAGSFPKPIYWFDCDARLRPVIRFHKKHLNQIEADKYWRDYPKFASKLERLLRNNSYATIVVDSLTSLADMIILQSINAARGGGHAQKLIGGVNVAQMEDYNMESSALTQVLDALRGLKSNIILTAHVIRTETEDLKTKKIKVTNQLLTGGKKIAAKIPVHFDEAYHFYSTAGIQGGAEYSVRTQPSMEDWTKTALPLREEYDLTNPDAEDDKFLWSIIQRECADFFAVNKPPEGETPILESDAAEPENPFA